MSIIVLIPFVICVIALFTGNTQRAFFNVYLPLAMVFPTYFWWKVAALPPLDVSQAVLVPLGIAMFSREMRNWRVNWMDACMIAFLFTTWYADARSGQSTASTFDLFNGCTYTLVPYMAGKLLIEQPGARIATVKRIVFLIFLASVIGAFEYRMGANPFTLVWSPFFPTEHFAWKTQIRWGWGRVSGPYGQSELAGMMFYFGFILALYLSFFKLWEPKFARAPWLPSTKASITSWVLGLTLLMTQARGPWLGCIMGLPVAFIGRSRNMLRAMLVVFCFTLVVGPAVYVGLKSYVENSDDSTEDQASATYRSVMLDGYTPIAKAGGPFGWGNHFPQLMGYESIDNEYLLVALTQGSVGLFSFCLLCLGTLYYFSVAAFSSQTQQDRYFGWSMLGIFFGLLLIIFTVFLGNQPLQIFFLMAGWSQAIFVRPKVKKQLAFQQVYT